MMPMLLKSLNYTWQTMMNSRKESSIYLEKENVSEEAFSLCLGIQPSRFLRTYRSILVKRENYSVLLGLNCEGAEDSDLRTWGIRL